MSTALTLTSKAQFTLNKGLLEHLGIKAGDRIAVRKMPGRKVEIEAQQSKISVDELFDILDATLRKTDKKFTIEEINEAIIQGYVEAGMKGLK